MSDTTDDITEIVDLQATKVAGVTSPANRQPFIMLKTRHQAEGDEKPETPFGEQVGHKLSDEDQAKFKENAKDVKEGKEPAAKADGEPHEEDTNSPEANEQQEEMTDSAAKAAHEEGAFCGDEDCAKCVIKDGESYRLRSGVAPVTQAAKQSRAYWNAVVKDKADPNVGGGVDRSKIPDEDFAGDNRSFPIVTPGDVSDAASSIGRAGDKNFSGDKLKENIKRIAHRKGPKFVAELPKKWQREDAKAAAKNAVQDGLQGTKTPEYAGTIDGSKQSMQPATGGVRTDLGSVVPSDQDPSSVPGVIARLRGGQSAYEIPAEAQAYTVKNPGPTGPQIAHVGAVKAVSSLFEAMGQIGAQREAVKAGSYLQVPGPSPAESASPGSMPWESYDAATLDQVASVLAQCCNAVESICTREQIEALSGDAGDQADAWSLQQAQDCLDTAMGIVARLAYAEGAEAAKSGEVEKAYPRLRVGDEKALRDAHAAITNVLAEHERAKGKGASVEAGSSEPSEGDKIQMELTKEELADLLDQRIAKAQKADRKAAKKAAADAAKEAAKEAKRQAKKAAERALKNANNGGDISAQQMEQGVGGEHDANDLKSFGGKVMPQYINKQLKQMKKAAKKAEQAGAVAKQLESLQSDLAAVGETVQKFANRPRSGGPVLDGIPRGALAAASEGRVVAQDSQGSDVDSLVKSLREKIDQSSDPVERQALGYQASLALLKQQALSEFGAGNGPFSSALGQQ